MSAARLAALLEAVEAQIGLARASIDSQRGAIGAMRDKGYATGAAETQLTVLETSLTILEAERDKLRAELAAITPAADAQAV